jgi:tetratricopeptide (TPR) repeat protein
MSVLTATQVPRPEDEALFERGMKLLWKSVLKDPNVQTYGKRGQRQHGIDIFGNRNCQPTSFVGIQCKVRTKGKLDEKDVRDDFAAALKKFKNLTEYFVCTTADDDTVLQDLANELTKEHAKGRKIVVRVWGWQTLEQTILEYPDVKLAFDPTYGLFGQKQAEELEKQSVMLARIDEHTSQIAASFSATVAKPSINVVANDTATESVNMLEKVLDDEVNHYRDMLNLGKAKTAKASLEAMLGRVKDTASGKIIFRIKANIGVALLHIGEDRKAGEALIDAYNFAKEEPKAKANYALGLLLTDRQKEALEFAATELRADPTNEFLPVYLLQAAARIADETDPFDTLPDKVKEKSDVLIAHADYYRARDSTEWWEIARRAYDAKPDNGIAAQYFAESELEQLGRKQELWRGSELPAGDLTRINDAIKILKDRWSFVKSSETPHRNDGLAAVCNLVSALTLLERYVEAIAIGKEAIEVAPNDQSLLMRIAVAAIEGGDKALAASAVKNLKEDGPGLLLKIQLLAQTGSWEELNNLNETADLSSLPEHETSVASIILKTAKFRAKLAKIDVDELVKFEKMVAGDPRALALLTELAAINGFSEAAERTISQAEALITESSHRASRYMVAMRSANLRRWPSVIKLLDGFVSTKIDSQELRLLIDAFTNERPPRRRAVPFFNSLTRELKADAKISAAFGIVQAQRGNLAEAETWLRKSLSVDPTNLPVLINLFKIFHRQQYENRIELMREELAHLDLSKVHGTPTQKMALAHAMVDAEDARAMHFAYDCLRKNPNNPDVIVGYFSLIFSNESKKLIPESSVVEDRRWVRLRNQHGEILSVTIEGERNNPAEGYFPVTHPLISAALGKKAGDRFTIERRIGESDDWEVLEVKHVYLHALHAHLNQFNTRFPDAKGLYSIKTTPNDIQPMLDEVRRFAEANQNLAELYTEKKLPLAFVAGLADRDSISFADFLRSNKNEIVVCVGSKQERDDAVLLIETHETLVLDLYTAWVCATVGALEQLSKKFKLLLPRSTIDEIVAIQAENESFKGQPTMTVGWHDGEYIRVETTVEQQQAQSQIISERRALIEKYCEIAPSDIPDQRTPFEQKILESFGERVLDPVYLAAERKALILSEDMFYRAFAGTIAGVPGVWLQAALMVLQKEKSFSNADYARCVVGLGLFRHGYLSLNSIILFEVLANDKTPGFKEFVSAARYIGGKTADAESHLSVVQGFISLAWQKEKFSIRSQFAIGMLMENMIMGRNDWKIILNRLAQVNEGPFHSYFVRWVKGHFLWKIWQED